jgi:hypothetical protein
MSRNDDPLFEDPLFEALASLPPIAPDAEREMRVRARCHSAISRRCTLRQRTRRTASGAILAAVCGAAVLCAYLAVMFVEAWRLAKHL